MPTFLLIILAILLATVIRLPYTSLPYMLSPGGDTATLGLMTIDAASGKFHTFFYGQAFNGPVEIYIIAPLIRLFGPSIYTFFAGSMVIFGISLITTYLLVKEFIGKRASVFALLYCIIPPFYFYRHSMELYGYHVTMLILGGIIFLMALKISRHGKNYLYYIIFGFSAGLGLWSHYTIFYYIIPCVLFLIFKVRFKQLLKGGITGILPFLLGSLPWWVYNVRYGFRSLNLYDGHPCIWQPIDATWWQVIERFITFHVFGIFGIDINHVFGWILLLIYIVSIITLIFRKNGWLFFFYIIAVLFIFARNKYFIWVTTDDYRHALTIFSIMPLAVSVMADRLSRWRVGFGVAFISILIGINGWQLQKGFKETGDNLSGRYKGYDELIQFFNKNKISGFIGDFILTQDINFITKKKIVGAELFNGRSLTDIDVDARDRIAFVNCREFVPDIERLCYKWKEDNVSGYHMLYDFEPYRYYGRVLDRKKWRVKTNFNNHLAGNAVSNSLDRYWAVDTKTQAGAYFQIDLGDIYKIYRFEVINFKPHYWNSPYGYKIEVSLDGMEWVEADRFDNQPQPIFWFGPRLYWDVSSGRWQEIFSPVDARFLRITQIENGPNNWMINEVFVYEYLGEKDFRLKDYTKDVKKVFQFLSNRKVQFVYADNWLSGKIRNWSGDRISTLTRPNECWPGRRHTSRFLKPDKDMAVVVSKENEDWANIDLEKRVIGNYVVYLLGQKPKNLYWTGTGITRINTRMAGMLFSKEKRHIFERKFVPKIKMDVRFTNGVRFKGYTIRIVGRRCQISYFWELSKDIKDYTVVFVHFTKDGKIVFQNDHPLLEQYIQPKTGELLVERYWVDIPEPGKYEIKLGLYLPDKGGKRVDVRGEKGAWHLF